MNAQLTRSFLQLSRLTIRLATACKMHSTLVPERRAVPETFFHESHPTLKAEARSHSRGIAPVEERLEDVLRKAIVAICWVLRGRFSSRLS